MERANDDHEGSWVCWSAVVAGVLVAALAYMVLVCLGAALGGYTASRVLLSGGDESGFATGAGLWTGGSAVIALFLGSYFAVRFSDIKARQVAACQAIVIAAAFFVFYLSAAGSSLVGSLESVTGVMVIPQLSTAEAVANAHAVGRAGALIFLTLILGGISAVFGGIEGTIGNVRRPLARRVTT